MKIVRFFSVNHRKIPIASTMDLIFLKTSDLPLINVLKKEILVFSIRKNLLFKRYLTQEKGPISFSSYMEKCLLDSNHGYYMKKDVFNAKGDFITSPEISQMFGEVLKNPQKTGLFIEKYQIIGIWCVNFLEKSNFLKHNKRVSLVEFGPGRGTLMMDIIRVFHQFGLLKGLELNFIEYSPFMRKLQQENITKLLQKMDIWYFY